MSDDKPLVTPNPAQPSELESKVMKEVLDTFSGIKPGTSSGALFGKSQFKTQQPNEPLVLALSTEQAGAAVQSKDDKPEIKVVDGANGGFTEKTWSSGVHAGEKERIFKEDGSRLHFKPDGKGGETLESIDPKGKVTSLEHARPDGKSGVVVKHTDYSNPENNYTSFHNRDIAVKSMKIDWENGCHLLYSHGIGTDSVTYTQMTGPHPYDNFTAVEVIQQGTTAINYADGSSFIRDKDGKETITDKYGKSHVLKDNEMVSSLGKSFKESASFYCVATLNQLRANFWMSSSESVGDVYRSMDKSVEVPLSLGDNQKADKIVDILKKVKENPNILSQQNKDEIAKVFKDAENPNALLEYLQKHFREVINTPENGIHLWRSLTFDYRTPTGDGSGASHIYRLASLDDNLIPKDNLPAATSRQAKAIANVFAPMNREGDRLIRNGQRPGLSLYNTGQDLKRQFQNISNPYQLAEMTSLEMQTQAQKAGLVEPKSYKIDYENAIQIWLMNGTNLRIENIPLGK